MPRPIKFRKVCCLPKSNSFSPTDCISSEKDAVVLTVDEYETIRLIDHQGYSQQECGEYMKIARTTVQQIYNDARKKLASCIVDGRFLKIDGGQYKLCDGSEEFCRCGGCKKHNHSVE